jgi:5-methylcytosine-specific restriction endonuclease McrA
MRYDRRRRQLIESPSEREALAWMKALVRRDPCAYCGGYCGQMAADHIDPLEFGGHDRWDNITAAGRPCNAAKKSKPLLLFLLERVT